MGVTEGRRELYAAIFEKYVLDPPVEAAIVSRRGRRTNGSKNPVLMKVARNLRRMGMRDESDEVLRRGGAMVLTEYVNLCGEASGPALVGVSKSPPLASDL